MLIKRAFLRGSPSKPNLNATSYVVGNQTTNISPKHIVVFDIPHRQKIEGVKKHFHLMIELVLEIIERKLRDLLFYIVCFSIRLLKTSCSASETPNLCLLLYLILFTKGILTSHSFSPYNTWPSTDVCPLFGGKTSSTSSRFCP